MAEAKPKEQSGMEALAIGSAYAFFGAILSKIFTYLYRLVVAGAGPEAYGIISLGISVVIILVTVGLLGLGEGITRFIPEYKQTNRQSEIKGTITFSFKVGLIVGAIFTLLLFFGAEQLAIGLFHEPGLVSVFQILSGAIIPFMLLTLIVYVFTAFENVKLIVYSKHLTENITRLALTYLLLYLGQGIIGAALAYTLASIATFILAFYWLETKVFPLIRTKIVSKVQRSEILNFSLPLLLSGMMWTTLVWADTIILGIVRNAHDVGIYNAAAPTAMILVAVPQIVLAIFTPLVTRLHTQGKMQELEEIYKRSMKWILIMALPIATLFFAFSRSVVYQLFGPQYLSASLSLSILSVGYLIYNAFIGSESLIRLSKRTDIILGIAAITMISNIILSFFLSQRYGSIGSAVATAFALALYVILNTIVAYKFTKIHPLEFNQLRPIGATLLAAGFIFSATKLIPILPLNIPLLVFAYFAAYFIFTVAFKALDAEDIKIIKSVSKRAIARLPFGERFQNF